MDLDLDLDLDLKMDLDLDWDMDVDLDMDSDLIWTRIRTLSGPVLTYLDFSRTLRKEN